LAVLIWFIVKDKKTKDEGKKHISKSTESNEEISLVESLKLVLCSRQAWVLGLVTMAVYAPLSALGDLWGVTFIKVAYGLTPEMSALANNMLYLGVVIGSPIFAYSATVCGSFKKPMIVGVIGAFLSLFVIVYLSDYVNTYALFVLFFATGFFCGSMLAYPLGLALFPKSIGATITGFINMMSMVSGIILLPTIGFIVKHFWNGVTENGLPVYTISDFRWGLSSVLVFLGFGIILSCFIKDRSPNRN
jgi:MFS family permease